MNGKDKKPKQYDSAKHPVLHRNEELFRKYQGMLTEAWMDKVAKEKGVDVANQIPSLYEEVYTGEVDNKGMYRGLSREPDKLNSLYKNKIKPIVGDIYLTEDEIISILGEDNFNKYREALGTGFLDASSQKGTKEEFSETVPMFGGRSAFYPSLNPAQYKDKPIESLPNAYFTNQLLPEKGLGGWLKDNSKTIIGGLTLGAGAALTATGAGAAVGVPMMASGTGQMVGGAAESIQRKEMEAQTEEQIAAQEDMKKDAYFAKREQELLGNPNMPMMEGGGKIPPKDSVKSNPYHDYLSNPGISISTNDYIGQSHEGPNNGIPVDSQGNPVVISGQQPVALTEGGETSYDNFVFSDKLKPENSKKTFADRAKNIKSKYKKRLGEDLDGYDKYARQSMESELNELKREQQLVAPPIQDSQNMPKFEGTSSELPQTFIGPPESTFIPPILPRNQGNLVEVDPTKASLGLESEMISLPFRNTVSEPSINLENDLPQLPEGNTNAPSDDGFTPWGGGSMTPSLVSAGVAAAGNVANMITAKNAGDKFRGSDIDSGTYTPEEVDYSKSRQEDIARTSSARREAMRTLRNTGKGNDYASMAIDMILSGNEGLSSRLIESEAKEDAINTQMGNEAKRFNINQNTRADMFNERMNRIGDNVEYQQRSQAMNNLFHIPQQVAQDFARREQLKNTANSAFRDVVPAQDAEGNLIYIPRTALNQ